jgi:transposase
MPSTNTIHVAIELSFSSWLVAARLPGTDKSWLRRIDGGDIAALLALIGELRSRVSGKLGGIADVACCFDSRPAGMDFGSSGGSRRTASPPTCSSQPASW